MPIKQIEEFRICRFEFIIYHILSFTSVEDLMTIFIPNDPKHNSTHGVLVAEKAL